MMANPPENLVLELLRELRAEQKEQSSSLVEVRSHMARLSKQFEEFQETVFTSVGMAAHANLKHDSVAERLDDLSRRVKQLEEKADA